MHPKPTAGGRQRGSRRGPDAADGGRQPAPPSRKGPARSRASKLVHELGGSLATVSLHLQMMFAESLPEHIAQHVRASLRALKLSRAQLVRIGELTKNIADRGNGKSRRSP